MAGQFFSHILIINKIHKYFISMYEKKLNRKHLNMLKNLIRKHYFDLIVKNLN